MKGQNSILRNLIQPSIQITNQLASTIPSLWSSKTLHNHHKYPHNTLINNHCHNFTNNILQKNLLTSNTPTTIYLNRLLHQTNPTHETNNCLEPINITGQYLILFRKPLMFIKNCSSTFYIDQTALDRIDQGI